MALKETCSFCTKSPGVKTNKQTNNNSKEKKKQKTLIRKIVLVSVLIGNQVYI